MEPVFSLNRISFSSGNTIELSPGDILVIVGPNNSGKSSALREIKKGCSNEPVGPVIKLCKPYKSDNLDNVSHWLKKNTLLRNDHYYWVNASINEANLQQQWMRSPSNVANFFVTLADTENRLQIGKPQATHTVGGPPSHPFHVLFEDEEKDKQLSQYFNDAFGTDLILNRVAGNQVRLHCGDRTKVGGGLDMTIRTALTTLKDMPMLHDQGDGMRSFVGALLNLLTSPGSIHLIDEPEAFLHPPQARVLGKIIAEIASEEKNSKQIIISTHSSDFLQGVTDVYPEKLKVARLTRINDKNYIKILEKSDLQKLWSDPVLKFSNTLDALFHEACIICEYDADCRFYLAVAQAMGLEKNGPDVMYLGSGGTSGIARVAAALNGIGVPTITISDFDTLNSKHPLSDIIISLGSNWDELEIHWNKLKTEIDMAKVPLTVSQIKSSINKILDNEVSIYLSSAAAEKIRQSVRSVSPWEQTKQTGTATLKGGTLTLAENLLSELVHRGVFIVPVGELEGFVPEFSTGNIKGSKWVARVLRDISDLSTDRRLREAREFMDKVYQALSDKVSTQHAISYLH